MRPVRSGARRLLRPTCPYTWSAKLLARPRYTDAYARRRYALRRGDADGDRDFRRSRGAAKSSWRGFATRGE
jgi:hypothetical protein